MTTYGPGFFRVTWVRWGLGLFVVSGVIWAVGTVATGLPLVNVYLMVFKPS